VLARKELAEYLRAAPPWRLVEIKDGVLEDDSLRTQPKSGMDVRLQEGHRFILGEEVRVRVIRPGGNTALELDDGMVRTVTAGPGLPPLIIQTTRDRGLAVARNTGFIVDCATPITSCGPPRPRDPSTCLFVGVYGTTEVTAAGTPISLDSLRCTYVEPGRPPDPIPPATMPLADFQGVIDATTLVGSGTQEDRLMISEPPERPTEPPPPPTVCHSDPCFGPIPEQVIDKLPLPPPPPEFKRGG
jgi:hypothetical protein